MVLRYRSVRVGNLNVGGGKKFFTQKLDIWYNIKIMPGRTENPIEDIDLLKRPVFELCDFLIKKRRVLRLNSIGMNSIIEIPLGDISEIFNLNITTISNEDIKKIEDILNVLRDEPSSDNSTVINVINPPIFADFQTNFRENEILEIKYTTSDIECYVHRLRQRTDAWKRSIVGIAVSITENNGAIISCGANSVTFRAKDSMVPIAPYIIVLLSGESISLSHGNFSIRSAFSGSSNEYEDYEKGDVVSFLFLRRLLSYIITGDIPENERDFKFTKKQLTDAIRTTNNTAKKNNKLNSVIFTMDKENVRWVL